MNQETASRLQDVAARLFHSQGYAATGVAQILREAEAGSGSLYHFFSCKEDLLRAVLARYHTRLQEEIFSPARARSEDPVDRILEVLAFYRGFLQATGCSLGCPIGNLAGEVSDSHSGSRASLAGLFEDWRAGIRGFLEEGRSRFPAGMDLDSLATFVLSVMEGAVMQARVARRLELFDQSVAMLRDHLARLTAPTRQRRASSNSGRAERRKR